MGLEEISFIAVLTILASPVFLYLIAHLLFLEPAEEADLREYYYRQAPLLWGLVVAVTIVGNLVRPLVWGYPVLEASNLAGIPSVILCLILAGSKSPKVHAVLAPVVLGILVLDTLLSGPAISAG